MEEYFKTTSMLSTCALVEHIKFTVMGKLQISFLKMVKTDMKNRTLMFNQKAYRSSESVNSLKTGLHKLGREG